MARLVTKFKYIKPSGKRKASGYAQYIATRDGVDKIDDSQKFAPATKKQKEMVARIVKDFPDCKSLLEYGDYREKPNMGNASEFIERALEDSFVEMSTRKTYADYIALRPRAQRFGGHGLFTDEGVQVQLSNVSKELNQYEGRVWTAIISLHREDAERLGFHTGERWRDMLRTMRPEFSKQFHIPIIDLQWYAAFHNEGHHPHVHVMIYSKKPNEGYLSPVGVANLRSVLAKEIFAQDLISVYKKETESRDRLRRNSREIVADSVKKINEGGSQDPELERRMLELARRLSRTSGKKVYGYLKSDVKDLVDSIVERLGEDDRISQLYDLWYEQKEFVIRTYTEALPKRLPLSKNSEFKAVRNAVVREAQNILLDVERFNWEEAGEDDEKLSWDDVPPLRKQRKDHPDGERINPRFNAAAVVGVTNLLNQISFIFQDRITDEYDEKEEQMKMRAKAKNTKKKREQGQRQG